MKISHIVEFVVGKAKFVIEYFTNLKGIAERVKSTHTYIQDADLTVPQLVQKYGYPSEIHHVESPDGYILEMHRIPKHGAQPVLFVHGFLDASCTWVVMGPGKSLGYILHDEGYDVWLANVRGNFYSKKHKSLNPNTDRQFWKFTLHDIGMFDIPTFVDYVLSQTNYEKLHYIAHSQGTVSFWIMCCERPEYNEKIISMNAFGPGAYFSNVRSPVVKSLTYLLGPFRELIKRGWNEFMPRGRIIPWIGKVFCNRRSLTQSFCAYFIFLVVGPNKSQMNYEMLPVVLGHTPAGASTRQLLHYGQLNKSGRFHKFDYGPKRNISVYGSPIAPDYDLSNVTAKVALHYSEGDYLVHPKNVERLYRELGNPIGKFLVSDKNWSHLDYVWGIDAKTVLYDKVVEILKEAENEI